MRTGVDTTFYIFPGIEEQKAMTSAEEKAREGKVVDVHRHKIEQLCHGVHSMCELPLKLKD